MAIGWLANLAAAESYFSNHRLETTAWDAMTVTSSKNKKTAVLMMAYDRLRFCRDFTIPAAPTATQSEKLQMAQCETAYYLALHLADEDVRKGLHAQGVIVANVIKEMSSGEQLRKLPLPPIVYELMDEFLTEETHFYALPLGRDENKGLTEDPEDD